MSGRSRGFTPRLVSANPTPPPQLPVDSIVLATQSKQSHILVVIVLIQNNIIFRTEKSQGTNNIMAENNNVVIPSQGDENNTPATSEIVAPAKVTILSCIEREYVNDDGETRQCYICTLSDGTNINKTFSYWLKLVANQNVYLRLLLARTQGRADMWENAALILSFVLVDAEINYEAVTTTNGSGFHVNSIRLQMPKDVANMLPTLFAEVKRVEPKAVEVAEIPED